MSESVYRKKSRLTPAGSAKPRRTSGMSMRMYAPRIVVCHLTSFPYFSASCALSTGFAASVCRNIKARTRRAGNGPA